MATYRTSCPHCRVAIKYTEALFGQTRPCPNCGQPILLQAPSEGGAPAPEEPAQPPQPALPAETAPAAAVPSAPPPFEGPQVPERMKANRVLAGRACPECNATVELGDEVFNCQQCGATMHLGCYEKRGGCARCGPAAAAQPVAGLPAAAQSVPAAGAVACRFCGEQIPAGSIQCPYCHEYQSEADRIRKGKPLFLYIPVGRLIILSIVSFGLYEAYWIYKNWRYIKERDGLNIRPFWRGMFGIFFCHSLLRRIRDDEEAGPIQAPTFSAGGLATGWVILTLAANLLGRSESAVVGILTPFIPSFLCLVPVQNYINSVARKRDPSAQYYGWSAGHIVCLVFGVLVWGMTLIGLISEALPGD